MSRLSENIDRLLDWFIPKASIRGRTEGELARTFVFTHIFGVIIAQPMSIYLYWVSPSVDWPLIVVATAICSFWVLPFVLRWTGSIRLVAIASFQLLAASSLFGIYHYGGFNSPFLPWLIVSLMLGLFYLSKNAPLVLLLFAANLAVFGTVAALFGFPERVLLKDLRAIGWLSLMSSVIYMTWMALYYARIIGLRNDLESEMERQRATAIELEKARAIALETSEARSQFFAKMNHELRTPLNAIIGYSELLLEDCEGQGAEGEQRVADFTRINTAGRHLLSLVSDVLDADRIEKDVIEVEARPFTLGALADEVVATATPMVQKNGNEFVVSCLDRDFVLRSDAKKMRQVLLNLLSNAGKFTQGGTVRFELYIEHRPHDSHLIAVVSDTGVGISADALPRLFTDYEQADPSVFNRYGGTGIGLALSRKFSILLGGDISVTSRVGQGSRFVVAVPTQLTSADDTAQPADPASTEAALIH